jgi:hypothetical protein
MTIGLSRGLCDKNAIVRYHDDELGAGNLSVSVFATGHDEHFPSFQTILPAGKPDCNGSLSSAYRNRLRSLSRPFNFCCCPEFYVFGYYYFQDVTSAASSYIKGDWEKASLTREI